MSLRPGTWLVLAVGTRPRFFLARLKHPWTFVGRVALLEGNPRALRSGLQLREVLASTIAPSQNKTNHLRIPGRPCEETKKHFPFFHET